MFFFRLLIWLAVIGFAGFYISSLQGTIMLRVSDVQYEIQVWFAVLALIVLLFLLYWLFHLWHVIRNIPSAFRHWREGKREFKRVKLLNQILAAAIGGHYERANRLIAELSSSASHAFLLRWMCLVDMQLKMPEHSDEKHSAPKEDKYSGLLDFYAHRMRKDWVGAKQIAERLDAKIINKTLLEVIEVKNLQSPLNPRSRWELAQKLDAKGLMQADEMEEIFQIYFKQFLADADSRKTLQHTWNKAIPDAQRNQINNCIAYLQRMQSLATQEEFVEYIVQSMEEHPHFACELLTLFANEFTSTTKTLTSRIESWAEAQKPTDLQLQLCAKFLLGFICLQQKLWGKAKKSLLSFAHHEIVQTDERYLPLAQSAYQFLIVLAEHAQEDVIPLYRAMPLTKQSMHVDLLPSADSRLFTD